MAFRMYSLFVENPPHGQDKFVLVEGGFSCALDLVKYIRLKYGDYFGVTVAGYPEAHPDVIAGEEGAAEEAYKKDLVYLKSKVDAGSSTQVDDDEELARTLQASMDIASPPRPEPTPSYQTPYTYPSGYRI